MPVAAPSGEDRSVPLLAFQFHVGRLDAVDAHCLSQPPFGGERNCTSFKFVFLERRRRGRGFPRLQLLVGIGGGGTALVSGGCKVGGNGGQ